MAKLAVLVTLACLAGPALLLATSAAGQRPLPISGDEAGSGPSASVPVPAVPPVVDAPAASSASASSPSATSRPGCSLGAFHAVGDSWFSSGREGCLKYTCQRSGVVSSQPCPRVLAPEGCSVVEGDADALYPACCPRRECSPGAAVPLPAVVTESASAPTTAAPASSSTEQASTTTTTASTSTAAP
ncbi:U-scoloptoxin(16)-Er7a [Frankliniella fusca]|uniref:U-scoloptoxin(16)-Er7a n=1 Tax=Frankliniella fusca TaxID=407009 RepID=A0AAE1HIT1_9NEOP|nr:U-scoloptoxin(16)-Er7a [Frankliniella fusca]